MWELFQRCPLTRLPTSSALQQSPEHQTPETFNQDSAGLLYDT